MMVEVSGILYGLVQTRANACTGGYFLIVSKEWYNDGSIKINIYLKKKIKIIPQILTHPLNIAPIRLSPLGSRS